ncbi:MULTISPECIES: GNAT family N-acetyltransferase [Nostocales]|uniref:Alanine acetyltransferase n=3 Tax=Nostocales TaxID=1161 RepID=A0A0C1NCK7_9CYAN|nr:GNAT family N-acetyltransferase [Tolypothrix bouteillei]KAF3891324.1 GNAT family N-acetyltransferase [Tolypothrix bouteillei VB521301]
MKMELPLITTERLLLRLATKEDISAILKFYTDNKTFLTPYSPAWAEGFFTEDYWSWRIDSDRKEFLNDISLRLFIFLQNDPKTIIGLINFSNFTRRAAQYCNVGYGLAETEQGKGYMVEALQAAIQYVFQELNMHRVMANYMPHNRRSGNVLKKLGFVIEGYARDYLLIHEKWEDHILTSITNYNWRLKN